LHAKTAKIAKAQGLYTVLAPFDLHFVPLHEICAEQCFCGCSVATQGTMPYNTTAGTKIKKAKLLKTLPLYKL
jgi:hypothetical protein